LENLDNTDVFNLVEPAKTIQDLLASLLEPKVESPNPQDLLASLLVPKVVSPIPQDIVTKYNLDTSYYTKYADAGGIPILASDNVSDEDIIAHAKRLTSEILKGRDDIKQKIIESDVRIVLHAETDGTPDIPEFPNINAGGFVTNDNLGKPVAVSNVSEKNFDIFLHEMAHVIDFYALSKSPNFSNELNDLYEKEKTKFTGAYAETNKQEFWASIVQLYYGKYDDADAIKLSDGTTISTIEELRVHSPDSVEFLERYLPPINKA
jgi:hypothetical protein